MTMQPIAKVRIGANPEHSSKSIPNHLVFIKNDDEKFDGGVPGKKIRFSISR